MIPQQTRIPYDSVMDYSLKDKWVLITGASSGFGAAAAKAFAQHGARLLLGARRVNKLSEVAAAALQAGAAKAEYNALDVASTSSVNGYLTWMTTLTDRVDVLINNAGGAHGFDTVAAGKDADWEAMIQSNVLGVLRMTRAVLPLIPHDAGSSIINIGSVAGHVAYEGGAAYCAAKAGELQITRALRLELNGTGIRVSTLDPAWLKHEFSLVRVQRRCGRSDAKKVYEGTNPLTGGGYRRHAGVRWRPGMHVNIDEVLIKPVGPGCHPQSVSSENRLARAHPE
jgi:NADP-dependent 3-hydroxy acid dehydrogenase YdfG